MRLGSLFTTIIGLGVAGGAVYYAQTQMNAAPAETAVAAPSMVRVLAASQNIEFGQNIQSHMLTTIEWPADSVPENAITEASAIIPSNGLDPRRAKRTMVRGELISMDKVSDWGEKVTIVQTLGENNRAVSITVNAATGVGGFVTPGDEVDIVMTSGSGNDLRAVTILQKIRVIAIDQMSDEQLDQAVIARTITVEVTPQQGQKLALAQRVGSLSLSLRSNETADEKPLNAVRVSDLMIEESPDAETVTKNVVRVRRGIQNVEDQIVNADGEVVEAEDAVDAAEEQILN